MDTKELRSVIFRHLDGIVTLPIINELFKKGILDAINNNNELSLSDILEKNKGNAGYINVALRVLASQGFLTYQTKPEIIVYKTSKLNHLLKYAGFVEPIAKLNASIQNSTDDFFDKETILHFQSIFEQIKEDSLLPESISDEDNIVREQFKYYVEGSLVGPIIVHLGMNGFFHKYFMESNFKAEEFHKEPESFEIILDYLSHLGWLNKKNNHYSFTEKGLFFARRATSYGVTVSYLPMLSQMQHLLFGNVSDIKQDNGGSYEIHVDRAMNVWGSGGAHALYFKALDEIVIDIFNKPLNEQPKGILDMGCGNGALLEHLFYTIENRTLRGKNLDSHPLFLVGADYNQAALKITRTNLISNNIWAKVIWGDIGNPSKLASDLKDDYNIDLRDLLNMRTFLDHNRIWKSPKKMEDLPESKSSGAYATNGKLIPNELVEQSLVEHLQKWKPYIDKFGLLVIELHTLNPEITANNLGATAATAYDATHGFSDQYILELDVFQECINKSGLSFNDIYTRKFPNDERANISIHLIK